MLSPCCQHAKTTFSKTLGKSKPRLFVIPASVRNNSGYSSIEETVNAIKTGETSAVEVMKHYLNEIHTQDPTLGSFLHVHDADYLLNQAAQADRSSPFAGLPIAVKDNLCVKDTPTTAGSKTLEHYVPSYDAAAIASLKKAGAIVVGKTNMDEFGMGSSTENSAFHVTRNPCDLDRVPGGSSGGSAAAVAAGLVPAAIGSDTGGSIRQPAHFCGIVGLKPTYGAVSRYGLISYGSSLDVVGPMANSVKDVEYLFRHMTTDNGLGGDMTNVPYTKRKGKKEKIRIGLLSDTMGDGVNPQVQQAVRDCASRLEAYGAHVEEVSLSSYSHGLAAYYVIALSEASSNLSRYDGIRYGDAGDAMFDMFREKLGSEVKRRILMGTYALSAGYYDAYYKRAQQVRTKVTREMEQTLDAYDVLLSPVAPNCAFKIGEKTQDPLEMYKGDLMTVNVNLSGLPALCLPVGEIDGLPVGVQLIGKAFDEETLFHVGEIVEQLIVT
jgi:aspartyl-tRNA(Asn)/glutamyl-tRNA(Gln) amidotransferase subunit A